MTESWWVMPREPGVNTLGMTLHQASRRWRVENYPATQFTDRSQAEEYAVLCRVAGLEVKIVPSSRVHDERAYKEYRDPQ
jgi:hypothetical protein